MDEPITDKKNFPPDAEGDPSGMKFAAIPRALFDAAYDDGYQKGRLDCLIAFCSILLAMLFIAMIWREERV